ncbi:MAG: DNA-binding response regulator [Verrucomicrobia bacterium]|nr:DNA-binding response regulator [Verrucomicrobiota bacterium]
MRTILVIDDNQSVLTCLELLLAAHGYEARSANGGVEGLAIAETFPVAAALVDVHMPGMSGIEVCRKLRASLPSRPVWLMTGAWSREIEKLGLEAGARAVWRKPLDLPQLLAGLAEAVSLVSGE